MDKERYIIDYYADMGSKIVIIDTYENKWYPFTTQGATIKSLCSLLNKCDKESSKLRRQYYEKRNMLD